jgi:hypothetical protein
MLEVWKRSAVELLVSKAVATSVPLGSDFAQPWLARGSLARFSEP